MLAVRPRLSVIVPVIVTFPLELIVLVVPLEEYILCPAEVLIRYEVIQDPYEPPAPLILHAAVDIPWTQIPKFLALDESDTLSELNDGTTLLGTLTVLLDHTSPPTYDPFDIARIAMFSVQDVD